MATAPSTAIVPVVQGALYVASGLWPIVHPRSFERVTGPMADRRMAKTLGAAVVLVGASLILGGLRRARNRTLGPASTLGRVAMGLVGLLYRRRPSPLAMTEAAGEVAHLLSWLSRRRR